MPVINALRLTDFRSYGSLDLNLDGRPVVLFGANGAGKTNLMESISLLSPGRGLRRAKPDALARLIGHDAEMRQAPAWGVVATLQVKVNEGANESEDNEGEGPIKIAVGQVPEHPRRRTMRIDGKAASGAEMAALMPMMWLTPAQDRLFTGPASDRRKFLDRFCLSYAPNHGSAFLRYEKARAERNRLLSDAVVDAAWYRALETDMAHYGAQVAKTRAQTVAALRAEIEARDEGAFPKARIHLDGEAEAEFAQGLDAETVKANITVRLASDRAVDLRAGRTRRGVHKSDLSVHHAPKNMPAHACSTGEQKALLIGLVLAQARALSDLGPNFGPDRKPILLLDEVAAHLDELRRAAMIEELLDLGTQAFLTGTDKELFEAFAGRAQSFCVADGVLTKA